jgi:hypothetical protein
MTSIFCHHPSVIFDKLSGVEEICPDCGQAVTNQQRYPTVPRFLEDRASGDSAALAVQQ